MGWNRGLDERDPIKSFVFSYLTAVHGKTSGFTSACPLLGRDFGRDPAHQALADTCHSRLTPIISTYFSRVHQGNGSS